MLVINLNYVHTSCFNNFRQKFMTTIDMEGRVFENMVTSIAMASMYKAMVLALVVEKPLKNVCTVVVLCFWSIVGPDHSSLEGH